MKSVGIIGTAKNDGKTTTLSALLRSLKNRKIAVTGIGYDGEEIDNITMSQNLASTLKRALSLLPLPNVFSMLRLNIKS
jgi:cobyric acid synthase